MPIALYSIENNEINDLSIKKNNILDINNTIINILFDEKYNGTLLNGIIENHNGFLILFCNNNEF